MPSEPKRKRNRMVVVCQQCRSKKTRCDKKWPCNQCIKAKSPSACVYDTYVHPPGAPRYDDDERAKVASVLAELPNGPPGHAYSNSYQMVPSYSPGHTATHSPGAGPSQPPAAAAAAPYAGVPPKAAAKSGPKAAASLAGLNPMVPTTDVFNLRMSLSQLSAVGSGGPAELCEPRYQQSLAHFVSSQKMVFFVELTQQEPGARLYWTRSDERGRIKVIALHNFDAATRRAVDAATRNYFGALYVAAEIQRSGHAVAQLNRYAAPLGLSFTPAYDPHASLQANLAAVMPPRAVVFAYLRRFFAKVYPLYPVVDEPWTLAQAERVFRFKPGGAFSHAALSTQSDSLVVAQVLLMMRMAFLTHLTNSRRANEAAMGEPLGEDFFSLGQWPVSLSVDDLALRFHQQGSFRSKPSLLLLQSNILRLVAHMLAVETDTAFSLYDADHGVGSLVSLALALNLDHDPDYIANFPGDAAARNLRRKAWYVVVQLDASQSFVLFGSRLLRPSSYNTKFPPFSPAASNIADVALEEEALHLLLECHTVMGAAGPLLDMCIDLTSTFKVSDFLQKLTDLEILLSATYGPLHRMHEPSKGLRAGSICAVGRVRVHYALLLFMAHLYFYLHLYYKHMGRPDINFFFFKKTVSILYGELDCFGAELVQGATNNFDVSFSYFMDPLVSVYVLISNVFGLAFAVNLNCSVVVLEAEGTNPSAVALIKSLSFKNHDFVVSQQSFCRYLAQRCLHAWKTQKVAGFNYKYIYGESFYCSNPEWLNKGLIVWSEMQLQELLQLVPDSSDLNVSFGSQEPKSAYDADLKGEPLYQTVQTDNFWIVFNSLFETEPVMQTPMKPENPTPRAQDDVAGLDYIDNGAALLQFEPSMSDFVDFNWLGGDWTLAEFLARNPNSQ